MNIHEYQAKEILKNFKVKIQEGYVANSPDEAYQSAKKLSKEKDTSIFVIKAQIHAGGRGKGKIKVEKRVLGTKKRTDGVKKKCERGVRSIDRKRKKFDPIIELSNLNWRHNLNATYVR